jgi:ferrochelatase
LAARRTKNLLVIPIAFVSDHVETLNEIDLEARREAANLGIEHFEMMPGLNDSPRFIAALADLVLAAVGSRLAERISAPCVV